ncbi:MAG TPA: helix-hairpin-helix domain-containing protein [Anaerolineaceae bacterium]
MATSWWVWLLIIVILIIILVLIWWFTRPKKQTEQSSPKIEAAAAPPEPAAPEVLAEPEAPPTPSVPDDLIIIEGIGPKISQVLANAGITTFAQLAEMEPAKISEILHSAGLRLADPTSWPKQAKLAAEGKMDELKAFQDTLKGGKE